MNLNFLALGIVCLSLLGTPTIGIADIADASQTSKAIPIPPPPPLKARGHILADYQSGQIITEHQAHARLEPASLTKMMTVYVVDHQIHNGKLKLDEMVNISQKAWRMPGSRMFLDLNSKVPVEQLLKGIIIQSGNDASVAIAEHVAGSEEAFVQLMNSYAASLGMHHTHFANATGMPHPDHYTTAADMLILAKAVIGDFPETYKLYSERVFIYKNIRQTNRNRLLWRGQNRYDGIKTGHTDSAGYCLVASGKSGHHRLIAVVMGTPSDDARNSDAERLLTYGFRFFETHKLYDGHKTLEEKRIFMGRRKLLAVGLSQDLYITLGQGLYSRLKAQITVDKLIKAPIEKDTVVGHLVVKLEDKILVERPIIALERIEKGTYIGQLIDYFTLSLHRLLRKMID